MTVVRQSPAVSLCFPLTLSTHTDPTWDSFDHTQSRPRRPAEVGQVRHHLLAPITTKLTASKP